MLPVVGDSVFLGPGPPVFDGDDRIQRERRIQGADDDDEIRGVSAVRRFDRIVVARQVEQSEK
jgi:hypothetical protein